MKLVHNVQPQPGDVTVQRKGKKKILIPISHAHSVLKDFRSQVGD